jgi:hypothetical protein
MGTVMRGLRGLCVAGLFAGVAAQAQEEQQVPPLPPRERAPGLLSALSPFLFPKIVQDGQSLKEFIRSEEFAAARTGRGDLYAVDLVFDTALRSSWDNPYEALLITFVAVMDHRTFGVRLPVVGELLWFPLTSEFSDDFAARVAALPARLYADTPAGSAGDRDKLQHFFGSALLTFLTESPDAAERAGEFVEWGEGEFIVGGFYDERDLRANRQGQRFARRLLADPAARPSVSLQDNDADIMPPLPNRIMPRDSRADSLQVHLEAQ